MPPGVVQPQPPSHHLATDAGPYRDATPAGEMPPTYNPTWGEADTPGAQEGPMGRVIGGRDSKGR